MLTSVQPPEREEEAGVAVAEVAEVAVERVIV